VQLLAHTLPELAQASEPTAAGCPVAAVNLAKAERNRLRRDRRPVGGGSVLEGLADEEEEVAPEQEQERLDDDCKRKEAKSRSAFAKARRSGTRADALSDDSDRRLSDRCVFLSDRRASRWLSTGLNLAGRAPSGPAAPPSLARTASSISSAVSSFGWASLSETAAKWSTVDRR
jgi:hypothetical protein